MAKEIITSITINASPEKVWAIFSDFSNYPNWNPFIKSLKGNIAVGNRIEVLIAPPGAKAMVFKPKVLEFEHNKKFRWLGNFIIPGLFDGKHYFEVVDNQDGTTTFIQSEQFRGILVPFLSKMLDVDTKNGFEMMNQQLKEKSEASK
jgi:hypothetical protein